ncbi:hypothetical protein NDU88_002815 [Pleurodeles waltl]|uniref:Uncharacterized protein n=1 Tax=Pleurodeles waltl TaxID=8319 RepID=A0AAV7KTW0_PLEWA|nr:hypothetical protein NDU88_002815 [Pleurodeles waltl]
MERPAREGTDSWPLRVIGVEINQRGEPVASAGKRPAEEERLVLRRRAGKKEPEQHPSRRSASLEGEAGGDHCSLRWELRHRGAVRFAFSYLRGDSGE